MATFTPCRPGWALGSRAKRLQLAILLINSIGLVNCEAQQQQQAPVVSVGQTPTQKPHQNQYNHHQHEQQQQPAVVHKILIPNLPAKHYQFWLKNHPLAFREFQSICSNYKPGQLKRLDQFRALNSNLTFECPLYLTDLNYGKSVLDAICSKIHLVSKSCWGYETNCQIIHLMPECYGSKLGQARDEQEQKIKWFSQADFGYILDRRKELSKFCSPDKYSNDSSSIRSSFECTKYFKTCRAENLLMKFDNIPKGFGPISNSKDMYKNSLVGGWNCDLQKKRIKEEAGQNGLLQSWYHELNGYEKLEQLLPAKAEASCDIIIDKQAFVLKLDHPSNLYHYFCNFINLYATIHLNNRFSDNTQLIIWDNQLPRSNFEIMWSVFSRNKPISINEFEGKRVCFKKVIFALLPRMVDGLYYNTPLVPGCSKSGLFDAFNKHVLHKLKIQQTYNLMTHQMKKNELIRITIIGRRTSHRRILNEDELKSSIANKSFDFQVHLIDFESLNFLDQLTLTQNTDLLIGLHGAGLTNLLFLPDWAALIELYQCEDRSYENLARLRGINYFTGIGEKSLVELKAQVEDKNEFEKLKQMNLLNHDKFSNFKINITELSTILEKAISVIKKNRMKHFQEVERELNSRQRPPLEPALKPEIPNLTFDNKHDEL